MSVGDNHERPPGGEPPEAQPPGDETWVQSSPGGAPYHDPYDPHGQQPARVEERSKLPLVLAGIALVLGLGGLILGVVALAQDEQVRQDAETAVALGVATDNLQDDAVTGVKIAPGAIGPGKLADEAVTDEKIAPGAVMTDAIADGAVTPGKLSEEVLGADPVPDGSVTAEKIADGAVERRTLPDGVVNGRKVADDGLTGQQIDESTLDVVPAAETAVSAETAVVAEVAKALEGGEEPGGGPLTVEFARASSDGDPAGVKGPVTAECPAGTQVVGGGATIVGPEGTGVPVALITSTASGNGWAGAARAYAETGDGWRIDVTAVCIPG
jgi:hypothetical protein